ncbi:MAG: GTP 3',8-cyclase MoaA [Planctomycetales bacterium]|nr:GTP 3',8-cyclase MoaA [Planctomycetales bacterium]
MVDRFGRRHSDLRISVTDRCNIRCFYCMPDENLKFLPRRELLTFEEIARFVRVAAGMGIEKVRITGGEPLVRSQLSELIRLLKPIRGIRDIALTTNGILLSEQAQQLYDAGLDRLNISLDALNEETFHRIARRNGLAQVLEGIRRAKEIGFSKLRLNAVSIRGTTEPEILQLARFGREQGIELRFIEFMPLDAEQQWTTEQVLSGAEVRRRLEEEFGPLVAVDRPHASQPASDFAYADGRGRVGFINPVSEPFCDACNRVRLTSDGQIRNCLFSTTEWDARKVLRHGGSDDDLAMLIESCLQEKKRGHGIDTDDYLQPQRAMYQIGG